MTGVGRREKRGCGGDVGRLGIPFQGHAGEEGLPLVRAMDQTPYLRRARRDGVDSYAARPNSIAMV